MRHYSDPTANQALGTINREWNQMVKLATQIRKNPDSEWARRESRRFTGIYKHLLNDPADERSDKAP